MLIQLREWHYKQVFKMRSYKGRTTNPIAIKSYTTREDFHNRAVDELDRLIRQENGNED